METEKPVLEISGRTKTIKRAAPWQEGGSKGLIVFKNIIAPSKEICNRIFCGWETVPKDFKTRAAWKRQFFKIPKGQTPAATVVVEQIRTLTCTEDDCDYVVEKTYNLYHASQTQPIRKTPLATARVEFHDHFVRHNDRNTLIRWTKGEWNTDENNEKYWDETADVWGWKTFQDHFSFDQTLDHLSGKDIYGVIGAETSSYLLIDLDLHKQPLDLFLKRLRVLLDAFHGKHRCHFQVSNENAGGVHIILLFGVQSPLATRRKWMLNELTKLDEMNPGVDLTIIKDGERVLNIEVYPHPSKGHRLPLCRNRTMLLDKPLPLITWRGRKVQDVVSHMKWLRSPDRQFMDKDAVYDFVVQKLDLACAAGSEGQKPKKKEGSSANGGTKCLLIPGTPMKGRTRQAIIGFWDRGESGHFKHLNAAIAVTLRSLYFEKVSQDEAIDLVIRYVDELPNPDLSSRLANNRSAIYQVIRRDANKIWQDNGGQANNEESSKKWALIMERWASIGFRVSDKTTWETKQNAPKTIVDCQDFEFTSDEIRLLIKEMAPVLVGTKQARKKTKQQEIVQAVKYFLRYVKCHDREISLSALPKILENFDITVRNHDKQQDFFDLLKKWGWIYVRADYWSPKQEGRAGKGRARAYGIGSAMVGKFPNSSSLNTTQSTKRPIILSPTFSEASGEDEDETGFEQNIWKTLEGLIPEFAVQSWKQTENDYLEEDLTMEPVLWPTD